MSQYRTCGMKLSNIGKYKLLIDRQRANVLIVMVGVQFLYTFWGRWALLAGLVVLGLVALRILTWVDVRYIMPVETGFLLSKNREWVDMRKQLDRIEGAYNEVFTKIQRILDADDRAADSDNSK